jgi:hypothetical protein
MVTMFETRNIILIASCNNFTVRDSVGLNRANRTYISSVACGAYVQLSTHLDSKERLAID